jgi:hypothetical protein
MQQALLWPRPMTTSQLSGLRVDLMGRRCSFTPCRARQRSSRLTVQEQSSALPAMTVSSTNAPLAAIRGEEPSVGVPKKATELVRICCARATSASGARSGTGTRSPEPRATCPARRGRAAPGATASRARCHPRARTWRASLWANRALANTCVSPDATRTGPFAED